LEGRGIFNEFGVYVIKKHNILHNLINISLLDKSRMKKLVQMNKALCNMVLNISSQGLDYKFLAKVCEGLEEAPKEEAYASAS